MNNQMFLVDGHVYQDIDDGELFVVADDTPDMQGDVLVVNFDGSTGAAISNIVEGRYLLVAKSLHEYLHF